MMDVFDLILQNYQIGNCALMGILLSFNVVSQKKTSFFLKKRLSKFHIITHF